MSKNDYIIRLETPADHVAVEYLVRESFWNVYRPGCLEHYVLHCLRQDKDFVRELDFVMEKDGRIIGQNIFVKAVICADDGRDVPIMTMGPICIANDLNARDMVSSFWIILSNRQKKWVQEHCALKVILISMEKADLLMPLNMGFGITDYQKVKMLRFSYARN